MKRKIPFVKYTLNGNNFVLVDETQKQLLCEIEKIKFANLATNINFGVGADNFLVIQHCNRKAFHEINQEHDYWPKAPDPEDADFIFRMFEPDGTEAFSCGNGLMCIAHYLFQRYGIESARIVTQIPTPTPKTRILGTESAQKSGWVNLGPPSRIPDNLFIQSPPVLYHQDIQMIDSLSISFRAHDLEPFSKETRLDLKAYLTFIGEPHMVIFPGNDTYLDGFEQIIFPSPRGMNFGSVKDKRINFSTWLINQIGTRINTRYLNLFPAGINVNFVRPVENNGTNILEYRCFERGINRETLSCGTGALAISYISRQLNVTAAKETIIWPYQCRLQKSKAQVYVKENNADWILHAYPTRLFEGSFDFHGK
ncbi:MAG: diaminopimelate epimerase [Desulfobacteraceae bacterium]|nr:diaminopimelate epimerase [Desulfobacteraceae bacterium]